MPPPVRSDCPSCGSPLPAPGAVCARCFPPTPAMVERDSEAGELPPVRVGDVFEGKWRIENRLGAGGMGTVFLAHDLALDRKVAVKVLARELSLDAGFVARFEREARLTARLEHPNVVPVYAVGRHNGRPFMVMKKLEGETLAWHLQAERRLEPARVLAIFQQLCAGLGHIHQKGCVHRDIKAGNIFLSPQGHATILDFGVLRDASSGGATRTGMVLGTPRYMSPEQARGAAGVDHRADLYALGVLLFECLAGCAPFEAATDLALIRMHAQEEAPDVRATNPGLPPGLTAMVRRALAKAPEDRYQSADELLAAYAAALAAPAETPAPAPAPSSPPGSSPAARAPADPHEFDPDAFAPPEPAEALDPPPAPPVVSEPDAPARRRRWLWPVVAGAALLLAAGQLVYLRSVAAPAAPEPGPSPLAGADADAGAVKEPRRPARSLGTLKVASMLSGKPYPAAVDVDGVDRGETPLTLELAAGRHRVRVFRAGFQPEVREVVVAPRQTSTVRVDLLP